MKNQIKKSVIAALGAAVIGMPYQAFATNGYFAHGYGTKNKGMAGAGVALPQDSMAAATNPAGMVWVGNRMDLGAGIFSPRRSYTVSGNPSGGMGTFPLEPGSVDSDSNYFLIPHFARNWMLDNDRSFGVVVYGNGGMNTDYPAHANPVRNGGGMCPSGTYCAGATGVDLMQLFVAPTYSAKINDKSSWGVSAILAAQFFEARGLGSFAGFSTDAASLSDNQHDTSFGMGVRLGWQGEVSSGVTVGASYTSRVYMSEFDDYAGLFAEQGDFDIPANVTLGVAVKTSADSTLVFDVQHIWYSKVKSIANPLLPNLGACGMGDTTQCLGADNGSGFGWDDMTIYKLGYQWKTADMTWRVGYSTGKQPIPNTEHLFNIIAPAVVEDHFTFGFTKKIDKGSELNFAAAYVANKSVTGPNTMEAPNQQTIELEMNQFEFELSWGKRF